MIPTDYSGYWSAVAQIVPIAALALVVEVRLNARRWLRKGEELSEKRRIALAVVLALSGFALVFAEGVSLYALAFDLRDIRAVWTAGIATLLGLAGVVLVPIVSVLGLALQDWISRTERKIPWSAHRRVAKQLVHFKNDMRLEMLAVRAQKIELLQQRLTFLFPELAVEKLLTKAVDSLFPTIPGGLREDILNIARKNLSADMFSPVTLARIDQMIVQQDVYIELVEESLNLAESAPGIMGTLTPAQLEDIRDRMRSRLHE